MYIFEWLTIGYASAAFLAAAVASGPRRAVMFVSAATIACVALAAWLAPSGARALLAHAYLVAGYWLPGLLVESVGARPMPTRFEVWLIQTDATLRPWLPPAPSWLRPAAELAYLACYPLLPISFGLVWSRGTPDDVERFWTSVLAAGFGSYASLPWLLSRPPRAAAGASGVAARGVRGLNSFILDSASHRWNTFPSGHVAVSFAAAWSVWRVWPEAGAGVALIAAGVAVGAATGRYHYVIDVVAGFLLAVVAAMVTW